MKKELTPDQHKAFLNTLETRFKENMDRHKGMDWSSVEEKLKANPAKLWSLHEMDRTGGEPDLLEWDETEGTYHFYDCSPESPEGRRSLCYDKAALESRKKFKPENNIVDVASEMGVDILSEQEYRYLQQFGEFDKKTSSWLKTPTAIRELGGAIFGDFRYGQVFIYHNGAESYYASRGFRGSLKL